MTAAGEAAQGNYVITYSGSTFTISPKAVTVEAIANGKTFSETDPELKAKVEANSGDSNQKFVLEAIEKALK